VFDVTVRRIKLVFQIGKPFLQSVIIKSEKECRKTELSYNIDESLV
jgi:hypothetical protein